MADLALREELGNYTQNAVLPPCGARDHRRGAPPRGRRHRLLRHPRRALPCLERILGRLRSRRNHGQGGAARAALALESIDRPDGSPPRRAPCAGSRSAFCRARASVPVDAEECFARAADGVPRTAALGRAARPAEQKLRITAGVRETAVSGARRGDSAGAVSPRRSTRYAADFAGVLRAHRASLRSRRPAGAATSRHRARRAAGAPGRLRGRALRVPRRRRRPLRWIELRRRARPGPSLAFHTAPIEVAPLAAPRSVRALRRRRCSPRRRSPSTGASTTCTSGSASQRWSRRERVADAAGGFARSTSPRQALLLVPHDLPDPQRAAATKPAPHGAIRADAAHHAAAAPSCCSPPTARSTAPRARSGRGCAPPGLTLLRQGETSRHLLLTRFVHEPARRAVRHRQLLGGRRRQAATPCAA